ncbi:MAG: hypothetical protein K1X42_05520 [Opitutaceae bacterium]|nr:hypothetical protein [Opitutaceae bacterium]
MKESRYIELLNLYIDHRLTPAEAAELETEVQSSPRRRKIYLQYCRMQKACALIFDAERSHAPKTAAVLSSFDADRRVTRSTPFWRWALVPAVGLAAAIALVAVVGLRWYANSEVLAPRSETNAEVALVGGEAKESPAARTATGGRGVGATFSLANAAQAESTVIMPQSFPDYGVQAAHRPSFRSFLVSATTALGRTTGNELSSASRLDWNWLNDVKLPPINPLSDDAAAFDSRPMLTQPETRVYRGRQPLQGNVEMISFQFQR